jgi:uncharacterized protein (DUF488 family)
MKKLYTIGFTKKSAEEFFETLKENNVKNLIDVRLNNTSHLASFAKKDHLKYFLTEICEINYFHYDFLAPTKRILKDYKNKKITWSQYEKEYLNLLQQRNVVEKIKPEILESSCLLCSELKADKCHRRLAAEYLADKFDGFKIIHL